MYNDIKKFSIISQSISEVIMKSKLSALKFVQNNKKQVWVMIISISLTFMIMYIINFIFLATQESFKTIFIELPKSIGIIDLSPETMGIDKNSYSSDEELNNKVEEVKNDIISKIKNHEGISDAIYTQCLYYNYNALVGWAGSEFPLLEINQIPPYLKHMGAELVSGRLPEKSGEILVDKKVFNNNHMKLGGYFNESLYGETFKVVGILESDNLTCVGTPQEYTNSGWYIFILCDEDNSDITKVLNDIGIIPTEYDTIFDKTSGADKYKKLVEDAVDVALLGILLVVMIFLTISIIVAYVSFMRSRVNEYCLYTSIGFGRKDIYGMMMREIGIIFGSSILLGAVITIIIMPVMGHIMLDNLGLVYKYFYPKHLLKIIAAFMAIVGFLQIPIIFTINNIKTIDLIEE